jgi:osmotically inducible protein OsmC
MPHRSAKASWDGDLPSGSGRMALGSGAWEGPFSFKTRMGDEPGSNPEELIGAALAGCYSMALSHGLASAGSPPKHIGTSADVHFEQSGGGWAITRIDLKVEAEVPGLDDARFQEVAQATKAGCPVSKALTGTEIVLTATLRS